MRRPDWPERLANYIEAHRDTPFRWGTHDCCRFAAGAVEAMTGRDPMAGFAYANEIGAARLIKRAGSLDVLVHQALGEPLPSLAMVTRGDVVVADLGNGPTVGIACGRVSAFAAPVGILFVSTDKARRAWRIR